MSEHPIRPVKATPPSWGAREARAMDGTTLLRRMVAACLAQVRPNADAIARGSDDPEHVHQLRVGLRRLRSAAHGMQPFADVLPHGWEATLAPVFDALGASRDHHVLATTLTPTLRRAGAPLAELGGASREEARDVRARVRGAAFQRLLAQLQQVADAPGSTDEPGAGLAHLVKQLRKLGRQVTHGAKEFDALPFEAQHDVRKRLKRLRYLAEFAAPAFARDDVKAWTAAASATQDALGRHIDRALAAQRFETLAAHDARAWFAVGWLRARGGRSVKEARRSLRRLRDAKAFW